MRENAPEMASGGQIDELREIARKAIPARVLKTLAQATIEKPHAFIAHVRAFFSNATTPTPSLEELLEHRAKQMTSKELLARRIEYYTKAGLVWDIPLSEIPAPPPGFTSPIPVLKGMTPNQAFALCKSRFPAWRWIKDLDTTVVKNDRDPHKKSYVIWVRPRIEADEELKGLSANQIAEQGVKGITLIERLLQEWFFYDETNAHLDVQNVTLCSGSRYSGGDVPSVCWDPVNGKLIVNWSRPDSRYDNLRARQVVSSVSL